MAWQAKREKDDCISVLGDDGVDPGPTKVIRGWHGKDWTYNRAFVDGHAATQKILIEETGDANGYFNYYRIESVWSEDLDRQERNKGIVVSGAGVANRHSACQADRDRPAVESATTCLERRLCRQHFR